MKSACPASNKEITDTKLKGLITGKKPIEKTEALS
jgi:hypothetical protein